MDEDGFQLNVGGGDSLTFDASTDCLHLVLHARDFSDVEYLGDVHPYGLKFVPKPCFKWYGSVSEFRLIQREILDFHLASVRGASTNRNGNPRKSNWPRSHSPALVEYANKCVAGELASLPDSQTRRRQETWVRIHQARFREEVFQQ